MHTLDYCIEIRQDSKEIVSFIVQTVSVPVFFLVDGYLFARGVIHSKSYSCLKYVRNSLVRLLAPWALFTLTYTLARYAFELAGFLKERLILGHAWQEVAISAYGSAYAPQMYFLFSLFLIRLCSPALKKLLIMKNNFAPLLLVLCYFAAYQPLESHVSPYLTIARGQEPVLHALWGIQFYLVGIVLFKTSLIMDLKRLFMPFLLLFVFSLIYKFGDWFRLVQYLYLLTIFLFFTLLHNQNGYSLLNVIGRNTMGVYLIHAPIVLKGVSLILNKFVFDPILSFAAILITTLVLATCIVMFINSIPYGCLLFGIPYPRKKLVPAVKQL